MAGRSQRIITPLTDTETGNTFSGVARFYLHVQIIDLIGVIGHQIPYHYYGNSAP